ncbi:TlpA disulfide reductase family protein [Porticoccaceae bacterium LTM1]|nr:TlpA disulfide reductase family protein [Porticoccaceae bacterium LTM1]
MTNRLIRWLMPLCLIAASQFAIGGERKLDTNLQAAYLDASLTRPDGSRFTLADYLGKKPVYLKIWASWCAPCRQQMPQFQKSYEQYGDQIEFIGVNLDLNDSAEAIDDLVEQLQLTLPMAADNLGELAAAFNTLETPDHILLDKQGRILHRSHDATPALERKLASLTQNANNGTVDLKLTSNRPQALFFTIAWCDQYFQESHPAMAQSCIQAQAAINALQLRHPELDWTGVLSPLWTNPEMLSDYRERHRVNHPLVIDNGQRTFHRFAVKDAPTLLITHRGREVLRVSNPSQVDQLSQQLSELKPKLAP